MLPMNVIPKVDVAALYGAELEVGVLWVSSILMTLRTSLRWDLAPELSIHSFKAEELPSDILKSFSPWALDTPYKPQQNNITLDICKRFGVFRQTDNKSTQSVASLFS